MSRQSRALFARVTSWTGVVLFLLFVWFQRNDDDGVLWGAIYAAVAILSIPSIAARWGRLLLGFGIILVIAAAVVLAGTDTWSFDSEIVREGLGLGVSGGWMMIIAWLHSR